MTHSHVDQLYPIHPTLDRLIQSYKAFSAVEFPRGMPDPLQTWRRCMQLTTQYEARVIAATQDYLAGKTLSPSPLDTSAELKTEWQAIRILDARSDEYHKKLKTYIESIDAIFNQLIDCIEQLGNPCRVYRAT